MSKTEERRVKKLPPVEEPKEVKDAVKDAVKVIIDYLKEYGWEQVIINVDGSADWRLSDIRQEWLDSLG